MCIDFGVALFSPNYRIVCQLSLLSSGVTGSKILIKFNINNCRAQVGSEPNMVCVKLAWKQGEQLIHVLKTIH